MVSKPSKSWNIKLNTLINKELILQNEISEISKLPSFIEAIGEELELPPSLTFNFNLVLEEAISNIIFYAYPNQTGKEISVQAATVANSLVFTLTDSGQAFDPTQVEADDITLSAAERPIGGLGIFLIKQIMDKLEYRRTDGKNILTLEKVLE